MATIERIDRWIDYLLSGTESNPKELALRKISFVWTASAALGVIVMTLLSLFLQVWVMVWFGSILLVYYAIVLPAMTTVRDYQRLQFYFLQVVILTTFVAILKCGGITYSLGLEFIGLTCAMASFLTGMTRRILLIFTTFVVTVILAGILEPHLTPADEITPAINKLYHILNIFWLSGSSVNFILEYIKQRSEFEQREANNLKELDELKTRLYTNITHEFRTPLTIILGMANQIKEDSAKYLSKGIQLINRNARSLLHLVNQMLDMQKVQSGAMSNKTEEGNIVPYLAFLTDSFSAIAEIRQVDLTFHSQYDKLCVAFDPEKLRSLLLNLVSNALKFTPPGGRVGVAVSSNLDGENELLQIRVNDTGIGIAPDDIPKIFDRFYKASDDSSGMGIGLALSSELVKLMEGTIEVNSRPGEGTEFIVTLPVRKVEDCSKIGSALNPETYRESVSELFIPIHSKHTTVNGDEDERKLALIVEDHSDMLQYLEFCLEGDWRIATAPNGRDGLDLARECIPDVIVCDIMMPEMSGLELCSKLKDDFRTSHVPILMLTARVDQETRMQGLEAGADVYMTKPFYKEELQVTLMNLVKTREDLKSRYSGTNLTQLPTDGLDVNRENKFFARINELILQGMSDENFGIEQLCQHLAVSRSQLYRKFEALTDVPIARYIRLIRLQKAKTLLEHGGANVTEAAMQTGFRNLSHFSAAFKEQFGITPSQILRDK